VKFLRESLARTGVAESLEVFHIVHFRRQLFQERPLHILVRDFILDDRGVFTGTSERLPYLRVRYFVGGQALRLGKGLQGFLSIFTQLAVDLAGRKKSPVKQNLDLDDGGIPSVIGGSLGRILGVVDSRSVKAGGSGREQQPARQDGGDEQADQSGSLQQGFG
jgi:hypothetical protein